MRGNNVLGIIFANADDSAIPEITGVRSMASVPFGGGYRLIDFVLSKMVNAGMTKVGIITNNNYQSLMDHIGGGKPWDLSRKSEGLYLLPPFNYDAVDNYNASRIGALKNISHFLARSNEEYVFISDCTAVSDLDLTELFAFHEEHNADITMLYVNGRTPSLTDQTVVSEIADDGRITRLSFGEPGTEAKYVAKLTLMKKSLLERLVAESWAKGYSSFEKDVFIKNLDKLRIYGFEMKGFVRVIDSLASFFEANFALLDRENYIRLFCNSPVLTKVYEDMPAVYGLGSSVGNSLIADGCVINGTVENSILFRDCRVERNAVVKNSILFPHAFVAENATLEYCITDKSVTVRHGKTLVGADTYPVYIGKNIQI